MGQTKVWEFSDLQKVYKGLGDGIKFNDLVMTLVSNALKEQFVKQGSKTDKLICVVPVNMRFPS